MSTLKVENNIKEVLNNIFNRTVLPRVLMLGEECVVDEETARRLSHALIFTPEIGCVCGNVSQETWERVSRALRVVLAHRLSPIDINLNTTVHMDDEEAAAYLQHARQVLRAQ